MRTIGFLPLVKNDLERCKTHCHQAKTRVINPTRFLVLNEGWIFNDMWTINTAKIPMGTLM